MGFDKQKQDCLERLDKSNKRSIDTDIKPLVDFFNSHDDYYTTSSCSGRILLIEKKSDNKKDARFKFAEHKKADPASIKASLKNISKNDIWLRQESIILHVSCRDLKAALRLLRMVRDLGIKRAGMINADKRIIIEIIGTESMETIIARDGRILVNDEYLNLLVMEANKKIERNSNKIKELYERLSLQ